MHYPQGYPLIRPRRLRYNENIRALVRETHLRKQDFILPLFIREGEGIRNPISSMPGQFQLSIDTLEAEISTILPLGISGVILFGIPEHKDASGSASCLDQGIIQRAIGTIKRVAPNLLVFSDICFCEYTDHGHCGIVNDKTGKLDVDNDATLPLLARQAVSHAKAGADVIAPSGNIDGMVLGIRQALDEAGFIHIPILSYAVKYSSALYGPFRQAAEGAPRFGDRKTYQMDPANRNEYLRECELDLAEGADMLMVKPASIYLDIIHQVKAHYPAIPLAAYHVSGEYAMLKAAALNGWIDERSSTLEILTSIKRAGADFIISYYAKEVAQWLIV